MRKRRRPWYGSACLQRVDQADWYGRRVCQDAQVLNSPRPAGAAAADQVRRVVTLLPLRLFLCEFLSAFAYISDDGVWCRSRVSRRARRSTLFVRRSRKPAGAWRPSSPNEHRTVPPKARPPMVVKRARVQALELLLLFCACTAFVLGKKVPTLLLLSVSAVGQVNKSTRLTMGWRLRTSSR